MRERERESVRNLWEIGSKIIRIFIRIFIRRKRKDRSRLIGRLIGKIEDRRSFRQQVIPIEVNISKKKDDPKPHWMKSKARRCGRRCGRRFKKSSGGTRSAAGGAAGSDVALLGG